MKKSNSASKPAQKNMGMNKVKAIPAEKSRIDERSNKTVSNKNPKKY